MPTAKPKLKGMPFIVGLTVLFVLQVSSALGGIQIQGAYEAGAKKYHYNILNTSTTTSYKVDFFTVESYSEPSSHGEPNANWSYSYLGPSNKKVKWDYTAGDGYITVGPWSFITGFFYLSDDPPAIVEWKITLEGGGTIQGSTLGGIPVELTSFAAVRAQEGVRLTWTTQSETENLGFDLYRSLSEQGVYTRINSTLIPGAGNSEMVHYYTFVDSKVQVGEKYYYKLADVDFNGDMDFHGPISVVVSTVLFGDYILEQNYPNPFNPETTISYSIKKTGNVRLRIYNMMGQLVKNLVDENQTPGRYIVNWKRTDEQGIRVSSGIYFYTLEVNGFKDTKKMVILK